MATYSPDKWVVVKVTAGKERPYYRVFASWRGGYVDGDSWKLSSGIVGVKKEDDFFFFNNFSGSTYSCHKDSYGTIFYSESILKRMIEDHKDQVKIEILPEDTVWVALDYN